MGGSVATEDDCPLLAVQNLLKIFSETIHSETIHSDTIYIEEDNCGQGSLFPYNHQI